MKRVAKPAVLSCCCCWRCRCWSVHRRPTQMEQSQRCLATITDYSSTAWKLRKERKGEEGTGRPLRQSTFGAPCPSTPHDEWKLASTRQLACPPHPGSWAISTLWRQLRVVVRQKSRWEVRKRAGMRLDDSRFRYRSNRTGQKVRLGGCGSTERRGRAGEVVPSSGINKGLPPICTEVSG